MDEENKRARKERGVKGWHGGGAQGRRWRERRGEGEGDSGQKSDRDPDGLRDFGPTAIVEIDVGTETEA
eukprot:6179438-Pleurochrysis_carterae.AAC.1